MSDVMKRWIKETTEPIVVEVWKDTGIGPMSCEWWMAAEDAPIEVWNVPYRDGDLFELLLPSQCSLKNATEP